MLSEFDAKHDVLRRDAGYQGFFQLDKLTLRHQLFAGGWSKEIVRELFVRGDAVGVLLYDPKNDLIGLVKQFRVGALNRDRGPWCTEVVAGMVEQDEQPEEVALRELEEESGISPHSIEFICSYLSSPGGTDERLCLYCALADLENTAGVYGLADENEDICFTAVPAIEVLGAIYSGEYDNAATLIALQWLAMNRDRLRESIR